jgi:glucan 1,3-beta-glucosidase
MTSAAAGLFIAALLAWIARPGRSGAVASFALSGALAGMVLPAQFEFLAVSSRGIGDWLALGGVALAGWLAWMALPFAIVGRARGLLHGALRVLLFGAAAAGLLLAVDGRYRDFPFLLFLMPVVQFGVALRFAGFRLTPRPPEATAFAAIAIVGSVIAWLMDWRNVQAFAWAVMAIVFAAAFLSRKH